MVGRATVTIEPSSTARPVPNETARIARYRRGIGSPSVGPEVLNLNRVCHARCGVPPAPLPRVVRSLPDRDAAHYDDRHSACTCSCRRWPTYTPSAAERERRGQESVCPPALWRVHRLVHESPAGPHPREQRVFGKVSSAYVDEF